MSNSAQVCAIDFGTSNSAVVVADASGRIWRVPIEGSALAMPTAVFYSAEDGSRLFGRAAAQAYVDGYEGRLMRSIKSILGSDLMDRTTQVGLGVSVKYIDVVIAYLRELKGQAEQYVGGNIERAVIGRPVFFVDGDAARDMLAQQTLASAAAAVGFCEVVFQYEPIAAALDFEQSVNTETLVLVADIGGGTSDFSVVRVGPEQRLKTERATDILANHGVHIAGTDFDREVSVAAIMPKVGLGSPTRAAASSSSSSGPSRVPSATYFDLATWHLINTVYTPNRLIELKQMASMFADQAMHRRLVTVVEKRLGHELAAKAETAKIDVAQTGSAEIDLARVEIGLSVRFDAAQQRAALASEMARIVAAAEETLRLAGLAPDAIGALYFTGGSTGFGALTDAIASVVPGAKRIAGDQFSSVVTGLGVHAARHFYTALGKPQ
ncbi:MAG: Hsp70 family protein [Aeromicrobium sp.]|nr:Hsp70 family protein [Burkholderiales bacterium]